MDSIKRYTVGADIGEVRCAHMNNEPRLAPLQTGRSHKPPYALLCISVSTVEESSTGQAGNGTAKAAQSTGWGDEWP